MIVTSLDETQMERMVTGFREEEFNIPGFTRVSMERGAGNIVWKFASLTPEHTFFGYFGDTQVVRFHYSGSLLCCDRFDLTYTIKWEYRGGNGETFVSLPPGAPAQAFELHFMMAG